jgi:hypothetical protein
VQFYTLPANRLTKCARNNSRTKKENFLKPEKITFSTVQPAGVWLTEQKKKKNTSRQTRADIHI